MLQAGGIETGHPLENVRASDADRLTIHVLLLTRAKRRSLQFIRLSAINTALVACGEWGMGAVDVRCDVQRDGAEVYVTVLRVVKSTIS